MKKFDDAIKVLEDGLRQRENRPMLRRALSNVYRYMYRNRLMEDSKEGQVKANWDC